MKLLIGCDTYVFIYDNQYYMKNKDRDFFNRYFTVFDEVRLAVRGREVENIDTDSYKPIANDKLEIYPVPFFQGPKQYSSVYFKIKKRLKKVTSGCDVAIVRLPSTIGFAVLKEVQKNKLKYAVEVVFDPYDMFSYSKNILHKLLWYKIFIDLKAACKNANGASYVSKYYLQQRYPCLNETCFKSYYSSISLRKPFYDKPKLYEGKETYIISHVANPINDDRKGHVELIKALKIIIDRGYKVIVKFAGEGKLVSYLKSLVKDLGVVENVQFVGFLTEPELRKFLIESDILAIPTKAEGLPRAIIEAMSVGLPCVSTSVSAIPELLQPEMMLEPDNVKGFANKIIELISNPDLYNKISKQNFEKSLEYEVSLLQARREDFYTKLQNSFIKL